MYNTDFEEEHHFPGNVHEIEMEHNKDKRCEYTTSYTDEHGITAHSHCHIMEPSIVTKFLKPGEDMTRLNKQGELELWVCPEA